MNNKPFQSCELTQTYDYITANYVMPAFVAEDLPTVADKTANALKENGEFIMTIANDASLQERLDDQDDLVIETNTITYENTTYEERLYYAEVPEIGKVIDYFRQDAFYEHLFDAHGFNLLEKDVVKDSGFVCTLFRFSC